MAWAGLTFGPNLSGCGQLLIITLACFSYRLGLRRWAGWQESDSYPDGRLPPLLCSGDQGEGGETDGWRGGSDPELHSGTPGPGSIP